MIFSCQECGERHRDDGPAQERLRQWWASPKGKEYYKALWDAEKAEQKRESVAKRQREIRWERKLGGTGLKNVIRIQGRYEAFVSCQRQGRGKLWLGSFPSIREACEARERALSEGRGKALRAGDQMIRLRDGRYKAYIHNGPGRWGHRLGTFETLEGALAAHVAWVARSLKGARVDDSEMVLSIESIYVEGSIYLTGRVEGGSGFVRRRVPVMERTVAVRRLGWKYPYMQFGAQNAKSATFTARLRKNVSGSAK